MTSAIQFSPRCSTPFSDDGRRVFYLPDPKLSETSEYNDWKKRLQGKKSSRSFKVRGSVPGVGHFGGPNALPGYTDNCSIISGHFEIELVPNRINEETIARPEPVYRMQWLQVPNPQFWYYSGGNVPYVHQPLPCNHQPGGFTPGTFFSGNLSCGVQYPLHYYSCVPKPHLVMCNYTPQYNYSVQQVQRQFYCQYNPSGFITYAAARSAEAQANLYPNYVPIYHQTVFSPLTMT